MLKRFTQRLLLCLILIIGLIGLFGVVSAQAATITDFIVPRGFTFNRNLSKGTTVSPDVYYLQNILNISTSTRVSEKDIGSNGKLTSYFGDKTESALGRFQKTFYKDIEFEKAISTTTGSNQYVVNPQVVDPYTRIVLNKLVAIYNDQLDTYKKVRIATSTLPFSSTTKFKTDESKTNEKFDPKKGGFQYSPQGLLLMLLGGQELVDKIYSYTPVAMAEGGGSSGGGGGSGGGAGLAALGGIGGAGGGSSAQSASGVFNFGGKTTSMVQCACSLNILLYILDVRGTTIPLMYQPGATVLYKMYSPTSGVNVIGQYVSGGVCLLPGTPCTTGGSPMGTMIQLGTSSI